MEEALRSLLLTDSGVMALASGRVDWRRSPQGSAVPRIVLHVIDAAEDMRMSGPDGLSTGRVQINCVGATYKQAKDLSRAVIAALNGHQDANFQGVFHIGTRDSDEGGSNDAERLFSTQLDFTTQHEA